MKRPSGWMVAVTLIVGVAAAGGDLVSSLENSQTLAQQARSIAALQATLISLEARAGEQPDWAAIASAVEPSVFTIETDAGLGSGWVVRSNASGSDLVTNLHVVDAAWTAGIVTVDVRQKDSSVKGTIVRVDRDDDLALVHVAARFPALRTVVSRPPLGANVMVVGSPLGLGGTVSIGVVSGFRSLGGSDYVQFSAPISPGNSGGPVVDRQAEVVGVATAKLVGDGVEALGFAIPVQTACANLVVCRQALTS